MSTHTITSLVSVLVLVGVHISTVYTGSWKGPWRNRFLSAATGVSVAYVVMQLLPELSRTDDTIGGAARSLLPFFERHAYFVTVVGIIVFYANSHHITHSRLDRQSSGRGDSADRWAFVTSMVLNGVFNFMVAYTLGDPNDTEFRPIALFVAAMALHYFVADHAMHSNYAAEYQRVGRWVLVGALVVGWIVGVTFAIPATALALLVAFFAGGVLVTVLSHELTAGPERSVAAFTAGALGFSVLLMALRTG